MRIHILYFSVISIAALLTACSTTRAIPDDEQLYTGIKAITYADNPAAMRKQRKDTTGVITAVADALTKINQIIEGKTTLNADSLPLSTKSQALTKEEKKALRASQKKNEQDFATAKAEVDAVLAYPPNNAIFGSSSVSWPWKIGLWVHNGLYDSKGAVGKWLYKTFGTDPVLISQVSPEMRAKVATNTLHNYGYFHGKVAYNVLTHKRNKQKAQVAYNVRAGQLYRLDSIVYKDYPEDMFSVIRYFHNQRLLKTGDAFSVVTLSTEQARIENILREHGFYYYATNMTTFRADTLQRKNHVQLQVMPSANMTPKAQHRWRIGHIYINLRNYEGEPLDTQIVTPNITYNFAKKHIPLRTHVWQRSIVHTQGDLYRISHQNQTMAKLGQLGVLSQMDINYVPRDTSVTADTLDVVLSAIMDKLYDSTFEMNATLKSNQQVGPGISYELSKRNAFRGAEKVSFKIFGSYEWQTGKNTGGRNALLNSYELGTQLAFKFPRFIVPGISRQRGRRYQATTQFAMDADWKNRSKFFNMVTLGLSGNYHWYKRETSQHSLTFFSLDFDRLNHTTATFDSIMTANPALYISMRNQFIPSLSYTFTYQSRSWRTNPWWAQFSIKEAGNLTSSIYAIGGKGFNRRYKELLGNPFAQFIKVTAELHKKYRLTPSTYLATRLFGGVIYSYGNSTSAPYAEQFYVGGANSVRAFTVRTIGPGAYRPANTKYSYMDQTGDLKLEGNIELRTHLFGDLHAALFLDAGNVWTLRNDAMRPGSQITLSTLKNIALGTGAGIRYDLDFLVLRFDVGIALHAPYTTTKPGFYNIERFKDGLGLHFAIGYPF